MLAVRNRDGAENREGAGEGGDIVAGEENVAATAARAISVRELDDNRQGNHSGSLCQKVGKIFETGEDNYHSFTSVREIRATANQRNGRGNFSGGVLDVTRQAVGETSSGRQRRQREE